MKLLLLNPVSAIAKSKNPKEMKITIEILLIAWAVIGLSIFILGKGLLMQARVSSAVLVFVLGTIATLFYGFLLQLVMTNLGGRGKFYQALTALTFPKFQIAVGLLTISVLMQLGVVGIFLSAVAGIIFVLMALSTTYRAVKDFFAVDTITAWLGISILIFGSVITFYILIIGSVASNPQFLASLMQSRMLGY